MSAAKDFAPSAVVVPLAPLRAGRHPATAELSPEALALAKDSQALATRAAYESDWRDYCRFAGGEALAIEGGATMLANYAAHLHSIGRKPSTLRRRVAGVRAVCRQRDLPVPDNAALRQVLAGARRAAKEGAKRARPLTADYVAALVDAMPSEGAAATRDRALILLAWQAALRRAEVAALHWGDYGLAGNGATILLRQSKHRTDAETLPIVRADNPRYCPIGALAAWQSSLAKPAQRALDAPIFPRIRRGGNVGREAINAATVGLILHKWLVNAGINPAGFSAHSLRAGFLTSAAFAGAPTYRLMEHSRHKRSDTLDIYIREARRIASHPAKGLL